MLRSWAVVFVIRDPARLLLGKHSLTKEGDPIDWCRQVRTNFDLQGPITNVIPEDERVNFTTVVTAVEVGLVYQRCKIDFFISFYGVTQARVESDSHP